MRSLFTVAVLRQEVTCDVLWTASMFSFALSWLVEQQKNNYPNDDKVSSSWEESWTLHEKNLKSLRGKQQQQNILLCYPGTYVSILVWLWA